MPAPHVLIVDDNPDDRALEARLLRRALPDVRVSEVASAAGWAEALAVGGFDLVITDFGLAWSDGLAVLAASRQRWPLVPVVLVTGTGNEEVAVEAMRLGAEDYVLKSRERIRRLPTVVTGALQRVRERERDRAAHLEVERELAERNAVASALARIRAGATPEETAERLCRDIQQVLGTQIVAIEWLLGTRLLVLGIEAPQGAPMAVGDLLPQARSEYLSARAELGPWIEHIAEPPDSDPYMRSGLEAGFELGAYVPLQLGPRVLGLLVAASMDSWSVSEVARRLPALVQFSAIASALLAPQMAERVAGAARAENVRGAIEAQAFRTVFQPIIGLASGSVAGFEALTRFQDGSAPATRFAEAHRSGLGVDLEIAAIESALRASERLPPTAFLSLNVSAETILATQRLSNILRGTDRSLVLELTEHEERVDDLELMATIRSELPGVRLAVDDAGAGYAGLRRILDLRPDFIKLDIALVRNLHRDPAREALIAGMIHFSNAATSTLIAEGIEKDAERRRLRALGVPLGQGFLLGRPT